MLGNMPVEHVAAMLRATPPDGALTVLLGLPGERRDALVGSLADAELARLLSGARAGELLAGAADGLLPRLVGALPGAGEDVVSGLPEPQVVRVLAALPAPDRARLAARLPGDLLERTRGPLGDALDDADLYACRAADALARMVPVRPGPELVADVLGWAVRVVPVLPLDAEDLHAAVVGADWDAVRALLAVSPAPPTDRAVAHAGTVRGHGYPVEVLCWAGPVHDPALKRTLARLVGH